MKTTKTHLVAQSPLAQPRGEIRFAGASTQVIDWKVMAGAPPLAPLVRGWGNPHGCKTAPEGAGGRAWATAHFPGHL